MWVYHASFALPDTVEIATEYGAWWTGALRHNGQLLGDHFPVYCANRALHYTLLVPEADSLSDAYANEWVRGAVAKLAEHGVAAPRLMPLGEDVESGESCDCTDRASLILYTTHAVVGSPLQCGDCFGAVPLYRVPAWHNNEYHDIKSW